MRYRLALGYVHEQHDKKKLLILVWEMSHIIFAYWAFFSFAFSFQGSIHVWSKHESEAALYLEMKPDKTSTSSGKLNEFCVPSTCMQNNLKNQQHGNGILSSCSKLAQEVVHLILKYVH